MENIDFWEDEHEMVKAKPPSTTQHPPTHLSLCINISSCFCLINPKQSPFPINWTKMSSTKEEEINTLLKTSNPNNRPSTITPPPRMFSMENPFGSSTGISPGPMTLVSRFFSDDSNYQSFSQLLAGAMNSPLARPLPPPLPVREDDGEKSLNGFKGNRPGDLVVNRSSSLFTVPPGLSPSGLLNSPAAFFSPPVKFGFWLDPFGCFVVFRLGVRLGLGVSDVGCLWILWWMCLEDYLGWSFLGLGMGFLGEVVSLYN